MDKTSKGILLILLSSLCFAIMNLFINMAGELPAMHIFQEIGIDVVYQFLEDKTGVRSSNYLEDAVTEIQVQELELDYACVLWDAEMRYEDKNGIFIHLMDRLNGKSKTLIMIIKKNL